MEFQYQFNKQDELYSANRLKYQARFSKLLYRFAFSIVLVIVAFVLAIVMMAINDYPLWQLFLLAGILIFILAFLIFKFSLIKKAFTFLHQPLNYQNEELITIKVTDVEIIESDEHHNVAVYTINTITEIFIDERYVDIISENMPPLIIPLRVFKKETELDDFLQTIQSKKNVPITKIND